MQLSTQTPAATQASDHSETRGNPNEDAEGLQSHRYLLAELTSSASVREPLELTKNARPGAKPYCPLVNR